MELTVEEGFYSFITGIKKIRQPTMTIIYCTARILENDRWHFYYDTPIVPLTFDAKNMLLLKIIKTFKKF